MNKVQKISFEFLGEDELFFRNVYSEWDTHWNVIVESSTERVLERFNLNSKVLEISELDLELEPILESNFSISFVTLYEEALENAIIKFINEEAKLRSPAKDLIKSNSELLLYFLLHGSFPWTVSSNIDLNKLFLSVAENDTDSLLKFLKVYGHYSNIQQRIVYQFDEEILKAGIKLIKPNESEFIISYVEHVKTKHNKLRSPEIEKNKFKQTIWLLVYSYLLTNRSSFFNKKAFLEFTIRRLANTYSMGYSKLLSIIALQNRKFGNYPAELIKLIDNLKIEEDKNIRESQDWVRWLKFLLNNEQSFVFENFIKEKDLVAKLLRSTNNHRLLRVLKEYQVYEVVKIIAPKESNFIIEYAKSLEKQNEIGMLQGRAGGEFRLLKWQIIFPVLLDKTSNSFNRKYFIERVLIQVASHYNLKLFDLLNYIQNDGVLFSGDKELNKIITKLYFHYKNLITFPKPISKINDSSIVKQIQEKKEVDFEEKERWIYYLQNSIRRNRVLKQLLEFEQIYLVQTIFNVQSDFIIQYAHILNKSSQNGFLQGKTSGGFKNLKWEFLHDVLFETQNQVFNKRILVEKVIYKIANHYNLKTIELISFLHNELKNILFNVSFDFFEIINDLYYENSEREDNISHSEKMEIAENFPDKRIEDFLKRHFNNYNSSDFLIRRLALKKEFVEYIKPVLSIESELRLYMLNSLKVNVQVEKNLLLLIKFSISNKSFNRTEILRRIILFLKGFLTRVDDIKLLNKKLENIAQRNILLENSIHFVNGIEPHYFVEEDENFTEEIQEIQYINNAGLVLIAPYLPRLFAILGLTEGNRFKDREAQIRAIFIMQYAVFGRTEFPEYEMQLNKILTNFSTGVPIPISIELTQDEINTINSLLTSVTQHWDKVKSIDALREVFLQREGKIDECEETLELTVNLKAYDMLLDTVPWNYKTIKFPWMPKSIHVKWR